MIFSIALDQEAEIAITKKLRSRAAGGFRWWQRDPMARLLATNSMLRLKDRAFKSDLSK
jgi:hypothetical protein